MYAMVLQAILLPYPPVSKRRQTSSHSSTIASVVVCGSVSVSGWVCPLMFSPFVREFHSVCVRVCGSVGSVSGWVCPLALRTKALRVSSSLATVTHFKGSASLQEFEQAKAKSSTLWICQSSPLSQPSEG